MREKKQKSQEEEIVNAIEIEPDEEPTEDDKTREESKQTAEQRASINQDYLDSEFPEEEDKKSSRSKKKKKNENVRPVEKIQRFNATADEGLTTEQVEERIKKGYVNTATKKFSKTYRSIFFDNICTFFNLLCLIAALALSFAQAPISQFLFVPIFVCNMTIGIVQEIRAKLQIDRLSILSSPTATVVRDGKKQDIPVDQLVVDDILILSAGQQVPADCIALDGNAELNESLLTGESVPIKKEEGDPLYAGSFVASGRIAVRVDKIGAMTYISRLTSRAKKYKRPNSEIINSINLFIKVIGVIIIPVAGAMAPVNFHKIQQLYPQLTNNQVISETIQKTASVVIGMIPSGLILLTTVALSVGMIRLAKYNTLVQDMYSLEMLARVNVLCLDKTGTITDGRMKVNDCILLNNPTDYSVDDIMGSMLASLNDNNQTSIALYERFGHSTVLQPIVTLPFSSARKLSAVTFEGVGTFVMGAPEFVLKPIPQRIDKIVKQYAQMGLRVLVLAHAPTQLQGDKVPANLRAISIITLVDNIRPDAIETIKWFKANDVDVKVISGDNPVTVSEVARRAGIKNAAQFISLEGLSPLEVENAANQYTVFGRVTPEQKAILIRAIKKAGNTVAMTGDGVNDILAMKEADCAVSVASGSEAARNVSNLVLQDNNFASMPKIVNEGRRVINNIKDSSSLYVMKSLLILLLSTFCIISKTEYFFKTNNMLMFEFFISAIPSFVLSLQPNTDRVKGRFIPYVLSRAIPGALTMAIGILTLYILRETSLADDFGFVIGDLETEEYHAIMMIVLTFSGLVMLYRVCQPFNVVRVILFVLMASLCVLVLVVPYFGNIVFDNWEAIHVSLSQLLIIIIIVQASFPVSGFLIKFFDMFNDADETTEKHA